MRFYQSGFLKKPGFAVNPSIQKYKSKTHIQKKNNLKAMYHAEQNEDTVF